MTGQRDPATGERPGPAPAPADGHAPPSGQPPGPADADAAAAAAELQARIDACEQEWRRALADADNLRKRMAREAERVRAEEQAWAAAQWLPVLDNLERALEHAEADPQAIIEGVRAVRDEAVRVLERLGFPRRDDLGQRFDPARHEAVGAVTDPSAAPGTVVQVIRPAYGDGERQLRPAMVLVARPD